VFWKAQRLILFISGVPVLLHRSNYLNMPNAKRSGVVLT